MSIKNGLFALLFTAMAVFAAEQEQPTPYDLIRWSMRLAMLWGRELFRRRFPTVFRRP